MGLTGGDRAALAAVLAALAAMLAVFGLRALPAGPLEAVVPAATETAAGETAEGGLVDVNTADEETLMGLPGIGEARAAAIVAYREEHGPFRSPAELLNVPGIGAGVLEGLLDHVTTGG